MPKLVLMILLALLLGSVAYGQETAFGYPLCNLDASGSTKGELCEDDTTLVIYKWNGDAWIQTEKTYNPDRAPWELRQFIDGHWTFRPKNRTDFKLQDGADSNDAPINIRRQTPDTDWAKGIRLENQDIWANGTGAQALTHGMTWDATADAWVARSAGSSFAPSYLRQGPDGAWSFYFSRPSTTYTEGEAIRGITERVTLSETSAKGFQFTIKNVLRLVPTNTAPTCAAGGGDNGAIYMNQTTNRPCYCVNGSWLKFSDDTAC